MTEPPRIYLDNAATSWPKPPGVLAAVRRHLEQLGAPSGRGAYREAVDVDRGIEQARLGLARLIGTDNARQVVFMFNGSDALNLAIHGLVRPGDHVVTTVCEHNSVLRPLRMLQETADLEVTYVRCNGQGLVDPTDIQQALRPTTRLVALVQASNVTGALQPVAEVGHLLAEHPAKFLVDAAQSLGHVPIDVDQLGVDLLAAPGHKGLLAPLGTGCLYIRPGLEHELRPIRQGGTGTISDQDVQPETLPAKYECGIHNVPGILGIGAAVQFLMEQTVQAIEEHEACQTRRLLEGLREIPDVTVYGPDDISLRVGVVSFSIDGSDPQEIAAMLDAGHRVQTRAGFHCAPKMHQALGTTERGGTVRLSLGWATTEEDVRGAVDAVRQIAAVAV